MLGGWPIQFWGPAAAFWFNAASFTILIIGLSLLPPRPPPTTPSGLGFVADFLSGLHYARSTVGIRWALVVTAMVQAVYLAGQLARRRLRDLDVAE